MKEKIQFAVEHWKLKNLCTIYEREQASVWTAESEQYGAVILKWNNSDQLQSEYCMLHRLQGKRSCKVYAYDKARGLLLEERILPGITLRQEPCMENRVKALLDVFQDIHLPQQGGISYHNWLNDACTYCQLGNVPRSLEQMIHKAREICIDLFEKYPERVLLHGDLHHDNLLRKSDGSYVAIDPKGVVGPKILDLPRFLLNEADMNDDPAHIERTITRISSQIGYPGEDLRRALYMEAVLANVWLVEDGLPLPERWIKLPRILE